MSSPDPDLCAASVGVRSRILGEMAGKSLRFQFRDAIQAAACGGEFASRQLFVLVVLEWHMSGRDLIAYPSLSRLSTMTGLSERTLRTALVELVQMGWLQVLHGWRDPRIDPRHHPTVFQGVLRPATIAAFSEFKTGKSPALRPATIAAKPVRVKPGDSDASLGDALSPRNGNTNTSTDRVRGDLPGDVFCPTCAFDGRTFVVDDFTELHGHLFHEHRLTNADAEMVARLACKETFGAGWSA